MADPYAARHRGRRPDEVGENQNKLVSYTGDAISMYTHTGTHIDTLNHFGLHGQIYNGFAADDNLSLEGFPVVEKNNWIPVHSYLLARDRVYEFAFVGASLKLRGASGSPMRPLAFPLR